MRFLTGFLFMFCFQILVADVDRGRDACIQCHFEIDDDFENPVMAYYEDDIHYKKGLGCSDCHGGNPSAWEDEDGAMWDSESFIQDMSKLEEVNICGKCHADPTFIRQYTATVKTDQLAQYRTSQHGIKLKDGNNNVATCTSCHSVHGIFPVDDPRSTAYDLNIPETCSKCHSDENVMKDSGLPTNQYDEYKSSVHGIALLVNKDIASPTCNDCHGNHGASPPDIGHITDICGTCHVNNKDLFQNSHLKDAFTKGGFGQCNECHKNHAIAKPSDEYLNWNTKAVCKKCHEDGEKTEKAKKLASTFYKIISNLKSGIHLADSLLSSAEQKGMEVTEYYEHFDEANRTLIQTRTAVHSYNLETLHKVADPGVKEIEASIAGANKALNNWMFRRKYLFIFSLAITLVALLLYIKIRDMEKPE